MLRQLQISASPGLIFGLRGGRRNLVTGMSALTHLLSRIGLFQPGFWRQFLE
jgi:hypothetical protein